MWGICERPKGLFCFVLFYSFSLKIFFLTAHGSCKVVGAGQVAAAAYMYGTSVAFLCKPGAVCLSHKLPPGQTFRSMHAAEMFPRWYHLCMMRGSSKSWLPVPHCPIALGWNILWRIYPPVQQIGLYSLALSWSRCRTLKVSGICIWLKASGKICAQVEGTGGW